MLLHKQTSELLADYCEAAAHVLRMAIPKAFGNVPGDMTVGYDYKTMRLLAAVRANIRRACLAAHGTDLQFVRQRQSHVFDVSDYDNTPKRLFLIDLIEQHKEREEK